MSDNGRSFGHSDGSVAVQGGVKKRKSCHHTSTSYYLAHPAPTLTQKQRLVHIRPKLLLQLQQLSAKARPKPTVDVISSTTFVPRLSKKLPGLCRGSGELGISDVMVIRSDDYDALDEEKELESVVEDTASDRNILAVICQVPKGDPGTVEICLEDGSRWNARPSVKGVLELVKTYPVTGEEMIARWVPRWTSRRNSLQTPSRRASETLEPRYQFSFVNPGTRRHPILATLTQDTLKISNTYSPVSNSEEQHPTVSSSRTSSPPSSFPFLFLSSPFFFISFLCLYLPYIGLILNWIGSWFVYSPDGEHVDSDTNADPKILVVYDEQVLLIEVSAVWIALKQGWCPSFRYGESSSPGLAKFPTPPSSSKLERPRPFSSSPSGTGKHGRTRSTESMDSSNGTVRSCRSVFARATFSASTLQSESSKERAPPRRTVSNGASFMQKAAARKAGRESSNWLSGSENDESRASSPRRQQGSRSNSVDIMEGVQLSSLLVVSPRFQIRPLPDTPKSPTKGRSPLSTIANQKTENKVKRMSNS